MNKLGYHTLGITALTPEKKMPIPVYTKVYSAKEDKFISEDDETLKGLKFLSSHFKKNIIRAMEFAKKFKGKFSLKFKKKNGFQADCKVTIIPIKLVCRPNDELNSVVCYGFGKEPMILITNLKSKDKRLSAAVVKVYLMRWRIEEFYRFKKNQFKFEDLRVRSLNSIRNLDLLLTIAIGYIGFISEKIDERIFVMELIKYSKRMYGVNKFVFYAIADGLFVLLSKGKQGIFDMLKKKQKSLQLSFYDDSYFKCCY